MKTIWLRIFHGSRTTAAAVVCAGALLLAACTPELDSATRIDLALGNVEQRTLGAASLELYNALQAEPDNVRALLLLSEVQLASGQASLAEATAERAARAGATLAQSAALIGRARLALGRFEDLYTISDPASDDPAAAAAAHYWEGVGHLMLARPDDAIAALATALERVPNHLPSRIARAQASTMGSGVGKSGSPTDSIMGSRPSSLIW